MSAAILLEMTGGNDVLLAVIGDVHAHWERLDRVLARVSEAAVDGILLVGDLGSHHLSLRWLRTAGRDARYRESVAEVLRRARTAARSVLWVPGNHDLPDLEGDGNVDRGCGEIAGLRVSGIGGAGPGRFGFCYEWNEAEIRARDVPPCDVLLCHAPPARTALDALAKNGKHVGSEALRERAEAHDGVYVCGHIHESPGSVQIERCLCLNVGGLGKPYGRAQVGFVRFKAGDSGRWEVVHEDLESGVIRSWRRS